MTSMLDRPLSASDYSAVRSSSARSTALMTSGQVAERLGCSLTSVLRMGDRGELTYVVTFGGHRRYFKEEIMAIEQPLLTPAEASAMLRVDAKTLGRWANEGRLACVRTMGNHRRYYKADIVAIIARRKRENQ